MVAVAAGKWKRVSAYFVDQIVIDFVVMAPLALSMGITPTPTSIAALMPLFAALSFVYWVAFEKQFGQTPGKQLLGIKTVGDSGGLSPLQVGIRSATKTLGNLLIIDCLPLFFGGEQRITEIIAGTRVVKWTK